MKSLLHEKGALPESTSSMDLVNCTRISHPSAKKLIPSYATCQFYERLTQVIKGLCDAGTHGRLFIEVLRHIKADPDKTSISRQTDSAPGNAIRFVVLRCTEIPGTQRLFLQCAVGSKDCSPL